MMRPAARRARFVDPVDQLALVVALPEVELEAEFAGEPAAIRLDVGERVAAVDFGLALAEQVEVRPVENDDFRHGGWLPARSPRLSAKRRRCHPQDGASTPPCAV